MYEVQLAKIREIVFEELGYSGRELDEAIAEPLGVANYVKAAIREYKYEQSKS